MTFFHYSPVAITVALFFFATTVVNAALFDHLLPADLVPSACTSLLDQAGVCIVQQKCQTRCFGSDVSFNSPGMVKQAISFFYIPVDAETCLDFEAPICPLHQCCANCQGKLNALYRCMIRNTNGISQALLDLHRQCPLRCSESNVVSSSNPTRAPARLPTKRPTKQPTKRPTRRPTRSPSA